MLFHFALQSVRSRPRSWLVGLLAASMAALLTLGLSLVGSIYDGTRLSMIESGAGHLQVYNANSAEGPQMSLGPGGAPEMVPLPDYARTRELLLGVDGVRDVVPLEVGTGRVFRGNYLDEKLAAVRDVARAPASAERDARLGRMADDLRRALERVARDSRRRDEAFSQSVGSEEDARALEQALAPSFWERFGAEPLPVLEFLENRVAKQVGEGESMYLDYVGTDLGGFAKAFGRFELVSGELPPRGTRGLLLGQAVYERSFKLPMAVRLDELKRERERGATFAGDERLGTQVERSLAEIPDLLSRLDVERATALRASLEGVLGEPGELEPLLEKFWALDDGNFDARFQAFYGTLAPHLPLYRVRPGDTLVLKGTLDNDPGVAVKVWGTYRFRGLGGDGSQANGASLLDLATVRHLSGRMTREQMEEAKRLLAAVGMDSKEEAPSFDTFSPPRMLDVEPAAPTEEAPAPTFARASLPPTFDAADLEDGIFHAALVLTPDADADAVAERIQQLAQAKGVPLATADWREVGGFVTGMVGMTQVLLVALGGMMGLFVLGVSAGTLLLLARERVGEVGTLRAVGMQRRDVFFGLMLEGLVLGAVGSLLGHGLGAALLWGLGSDGIAVRDEALQFFLGGAVLRPELAAWHAAVVSVGVTLVVLVATWIPAWRGSAVTPAVAMRLREMDG
ncbi:ABC transporter permease [Myxococcus vastator]|uniref:ABC transporter permease n=1 Tax=Myxococcus vastator TaxID=2709664 RepID=UPI0013D629AB|nr:FtsX-like permease family protein [Myxococcus vastator]